MSKLKNIFTALVSFTQRERRGILVLLPLLVVVGAVIVFASRPRFEKTMPALVDATLKVEQRQPHTEQEENTPVELFEFDPNTVDYMGLRRLGFSKRDAAGILKYRDSYAKVFAIPTDFAACYQVTDSMFVRLEPYIVIAPRFRTVERVGYTGAKNPATPTPAPRDSMFRFDPNTLDHQGFVRLGFSPRQADVIVQWRETKGGFRTVTDFEQCYVVRGAMFERLKEYIYMNKVVETPVVARQAMPIDINSADSATLVGLRGLGGLTVSRILSYRSRLGGFYRVEQLAEVVGVSEKNFELFVKEIYADISKIQKIDVNFATPKQMEQHPYMSATMRRKLLKNRQLKGGWRSITEMIDDNILTESEAQKLSHYLSFGHK